MSYVVFKYQDGKKLYLSTQGRWIKSAANAAAYSQEKAAQVAAQHGACKRPIKFRV